MPHPKSPSAPIVMGHELEVAIPGSFVVLQGSPGDGMSNTIETLPSLSEFTEDTLLGNNGDNDDTPSRCNSQGPHVLGSLASQPQSAWHSGGSIFSSSESGMSRKQLLDERSLHEWTEECRDREGKQRKEWKLSFANHYHKQDDGTTNTMIESKHDALWWQTDGRLTLLKEIPTRLQNGTVARTSLGSLSPGSTLVATEIIHLNSSTLKTIPIPPTHTSYAGGESQQSIYPRGRQGWVQLVKIVSSASSRMTAYVALSVDGYPLMAPGLPSLYVDPNVWIWRVTCPVGAFVRLGLELNTKHVDTIPYGSLIRVARKTVNTHGLSRLRVQSIVEDTTSRNRASRMVDGWCSEFLNPLSGQRGSVARPLSFPVPALYKVRLTDGAVIRRDVELSSPQIGHAPYGAELSIISRAFSEHPMDRCIERLQLAGNGGWISVRLNRPHPDDDMVVDFVGLDGLFDPTKPGLFHLESQRQVEDFIREAFEDDAEPSDVRTADTIPDDDANSIVEKPSTCKSDSNAAKIQRSSTQRRQVGRSNLERTPEDDRCLICLTEERNATIVHGETGHVACCLVCARILKARGDKCPVCRFEIDVIIQHFWA